MTHTITISSSLGTVNSFSAGQDLSSLTRDGTSAVERRVLITGLPKSPARSFHLLQDMGLLAGTVSSSSSGAEVQMSQSGSSRGISNSSRMVCFGKNLYLMSEPKECWSQVYSYEAGSYQ